MLPDPTRWGSVALCTGLMAALVVVWLIGLVPWPRGISVLLGGAASFFSTRQGPRSEEARGLGSDPPVLPWASSTIDRLEPLLVALSTAPLVVEGGWQLRQVQKDTERQLLRLEQELTSDQYQLILSWAEQMIVSRALRFTLSPRFAPCAPAPAEAAPPSQPTESDPPPSNFGRRILSLLSSAELDEDLLAVGWVCMSWGGERFLGGSAGWRASLRRTMWRQSRGE